MSHSLHMLAALAVLGLSSAALAEQIDNPEYVQWSKYKAGTFVTLQQATDMPGMANNPNMPAGMNMAAMMPQTKITTTLTAIKPESLTLDVATETTQMGRVTNNKTSRVIPAKIDKTDPAATAPAPGVQGEVKDMQEGKETLTINGNKVDTVWRSFTTTITPSSGAMPMGRGRAGMGAGGPTAAQMKVWSSPDVPGGMVKSETTTTIDQMGEMKMTMSVVDFKVVK